MDNFVESLTDGENVFNYENDTCYTIKDYIDRDIELLMIQMIIEAHEAGHSFFVMSPIVKMNYWDTNKITSEVYENYDEHWGIETLLMDTVVFLIEDLRLGRVDNIELTNFSEAIDRVAEKAVCAGFGSSRGGADNVNDIRELSMRYSGMIGNLISLNDRYTQQRIKATDGSNLSNYRSELDRAEIISESMDDYERSPLTYLVMEVPELIEINFTINEQKLLRIKDQINQHLDGYYKDITQPKGSHYQMNDVLSFSKQIENFVEYLKTQTLVENIINLPFSVLHNRDFEAVKMLSLLKNIGSISFKWNQDQYWQLRLKNAVITVDSLLGKEGLVVDSKPESVHPKFFLSFSSDPCSLTFVSEDGSKKTVAIQGQTQKEVMRIIFKNQGLAFDEWSLYDISEILGDEDVNLKSVQNAIYQFNRKVQRSIPHIKSLFDYNVHSAKLDQKYVRKS